VSGPDPRAAHAPTSHPLMGAQVRTPLGLRTGAITTILSFEPWRFRRSGAGQATGGWEMPEPPGMRAAVFPAVGRLRLPPGLATAGRLAGRPRRMACGPAPMRLG